MRKALWIALSLIILCSAGLVAYKWTNVLFLSMHGYRTPLKGTPALNEDITHPLTSQVVLILVDGLRYDTSFQMPYLNTLRLQGAHSRLLADPPSNLQTTWTTLLSGARPEINDAPLFDRSYEVITPIVIDHIFTVLRRAGLTAGIAAFHWWEKLVPSELLYVKYYVDSEDDAADRQVVAQALTFLREFHPNFLLVNLRQIDVAGLQYGASSHEYRLAMLRCDEYIHTLAANMDLQQSVLIVLSSHGHLDQGGYGGNEAVVLNTPFVMVGQNVTPGNRGTLSQTDIAPTIAALLGAPMPNIAQGLVRTELLKMEPVDRAEKWLALAHQRFRLGSMYLYSIGRGLLSENVQGDMQVAYSSLQVKNYESAAQLASLSVRQADLEMARARRTRLWKERTQRAIPFALFILFPLWLTWRKRSWRTLWILFAALFATALYHVLFLHQGNAYSFSRIPAGGLAATLNPSLRRAAISLAIGGLIVVWRTWHERERSAFAVTLSSYGYALLQLYFIGLLLGACTLWNGLSFTWYLPNLTIAYVQFMTLMQSMLIAVMSILLPIPVVILQKALLAISDWLAQRGHR
ncbi:MAG: alkaline phosphatase family protein [Anaerolineae bacterium]